MLLKLILLFIFRKVRGRNYWGAISGLRHGCEEKVSFILMKAVFSRDVAKYNYTLAGDVAERLTGDRANQSCMFNLNTQ